MTPVHAVTTGAETPSYTLERGWKTLTIAGGVVGLLGLLAIAFPFVTGLSVTIAIGAILVVAGIVHGTHAFTARGWNGRLWQVALAVISVLAGVTLLVNPVLGLTSLTLLAIAYLLVDAVVELWITTRMADQPGRASIAASGLLSLVLATLIWVGLPASSVWAVGLLVGVSLFVTGLSMVIVAISSRSVAEANQSVTEPRQA
ncbi:HdeD family acid-resistance protein [Natronobacterium gregoryi]|nr:DUF308 domain-containing protein [Natronobacterium gregoryi]AFZ72281.1 hypothetical protein Natgr_1051 [Natronobacterium gregoryi SP2]PLK18672.1 hypothetical protein CYV19_17525 [Natronobacterium gregoryi SP2]SFJ67606.1 Uncharacterized membrane protein HdeD, DUF308 family [Natronobacterium gregoryi]